MIFGFVVRNWGYTSIGIELHYYKEMSLDKKADVGFVKQGNFLYTDNPIYGLGNLQLYGLAIANRSLLGSVAGILSQVAIFVFYWLWEKPFLRKMYGNQDSSSSIGDTAGMLD
jgi:protein-S-isoprenylcysteine O-methyltransferase Ste14